MYQMYRVLSLISQVEVGVLNFGHQKGLQNRKYAVPLLGTTGKFKQANLNTSVPGLSQCHSTGLMVGVAWNPCSLLDPMAGSGRHVRAGIKKNRHSERGGGGLPQTF